MEIYSIETGNLKLDGGAMFGVVPKVLWNKEYEADENNLVNLSMRCMLIVEGDKKILIDTGIGDKQDAKFFGHYFLNGDATLKGSLKEKGFLSEDITDVVLTHLHFDHCGGAVDRSSDGALRPAFPNAVYHIGKTQWENAMSPNPIEGASFLKENLLPLHEHKVIHLIDNEQNLTQNIRLKLFNGHTVGQLIPHINYNGKTIVYTGDLLPTASNIPMAWITAYDIQPLVVFEEKGRFLKEAFENQYYLFFEHDIRFECGTLKNTPKGFRLDQTLTLEEVKLR